MRTAAKTLCGSLIAASVVISANAASTCSELSYSSPPSGICIDTFDDPPLALGNSSLSVPGWSTTGDVSRVAAVGGAGIANTHLVLTGAATARWLTPWVVQGLPPPGAVLAGVDVTNSYNFQWGDYHAVGTSGTVSWFAGDILIQQMQILPFSSEGALLDGRYLFTGQGAGFDVGCPSSFGCESPDPNDPRIGKQISVQFETSAGQLRLNDVFVLHVSSSPPPPSSSAVPPSGGGGGGGGGGATGVPLTGFLLAAILIASFVRRQPAPSLRDERIGVR